MKWIWVDFLIIAMQSRENIEKKISICFFFVFDSELDQII